MSQRSDVQFAALSMWSVLKMCFGDMQMGQHMDKNVSICKCFPCYKTIRSFFSGPEQGQIWIRKRVWLDTRKKNYTRYQGYTVILQAMHIEKCVIFTLLHKSHHDTMSIPTGCKLSLKSLKCYILKRQLLKFLRWEILKQLLSVYMQVCKGFYPQIKK